jgi:quinol monooxygenase YgiN
MYGTIARVRPKAGREQATVALLDRWVRERGPKVIGFMTEYVLHSEARPGELLVLAVFASKEAYVANANDPEQDRWYRELRAELADDPEWNDGTIVALERDAVPI